MTIVVQAAPGHRLAAKQGVAVEVVAELFQKAEDVRDAADGGQSQGVLLLVEVGWAGVRGQRTPPVRCQTCLACVGSNWGKVPHLR